MAQRSASASVTVAVDPARAFAAFTDGIDAWWVRGPINFFDPSRAVAMRIEPGVGGRVLEVYDDARGEALGLGRITAWEPGAELTYRSLVDDTEVVVRFEPVEAGTRVTVTQTLLPEGERAIFFWRNVLPWFGRWCDDPNAPRTPREIARLSLALHYADPAAAARWLARAFQLGSWSGIPAEGDEPEWIELHHGDVAILLFPLEGRRERSAPVTHVPWAYVDDLEAHFAHARAAGATIVSEIEVQGFRSYTAEDLEGLRWTFVQARPTME